MIRIFRETADTIRALAHMLTGFFVRWFLPLHSDEENEDTQELDEPLESESPGENTAAAPTARHPDDFSENRDVRPL